MVGGVEEHPIQSLSLQEEESLLGFLQSCALLTSASERGAFPLALAFVFLGVIGSVEAPSQMFLPHQALLAQQRRKKV